MAWSASKGREKSSWLAGHCGIALLDHAPSCEGFSGPCGSGRIAQLVEQLTLNQRVPGSSPGAPTKEKTFLSNGFAKWRPRTKRVSCDVFCVTDAARLLCGFCLVFVSSSDSIQRADPMVQVDYVLIVEKDIRASKTDTLFCSSPRGTSGRGFDSLPRDAAPQFPRQTTIICDRVRWMVALGPKGADRRRHIQRDGRPRAPKSKLPASMPVLLPVAPRWAMLARSAHRALLMMSPDLPWRRACVASLPRVLPSPPRRPLRRSLRRPASCRIARCRCGR